jgi:hypothetical protein
LTWTPLLAFTLFGGLYALGDFVAAKTKGYVSAVLVMGAAYLVGYWTGAIPLDSVGTTGMTVVIGNFGVALLITHLGTLINLPDLLREWKTVVVALCGLIGLGIITYAVSIPLFGHIWALSAAPPISGGLIASTIVNDAAVAAGQPAMGAFAMLVSSFQMFVGIPIASTMLKGVVKRFRGLSREEVEKETGGGRRAFNMQVIRKWPEAWLSGSSTIARLAVAASVAFLVARLTVIPGSKPVNYLLNPNVAYLLSGVFFTELGFLERNSLDKANSFGMLMFCLMALIPQSFASIHSPAQLLGMVKPLIGTLIVGAVGIVAASIAAGKILGYTVPLSIAVGITAMIGYPGTYLISTECVKGLDAGEEEKERIVGYVMPKMLVGGFTTVTIASVVFAGIVAPLIFK